jgi:hypothetical protein
MKLATENLIREKTAAIPLEAVGGEAGFRGAGPGEYRDILQAAQIVTHEAAASLERWALAARREGMSWTEIGEALCISKQAAQQRFRSEIDAATVPSPDHIEVRLGATAFNEERILDEEGRRGNELVQVGALALAFRRTSQTWEYRRLVAMTALAAQKTAARDNWIYVASWFPFHYFKRAVA